MANIVIFETEAWERAAFEALARTHRVEFREEPLDAENAAELSAAQVISTFIYSDLDREVLAELESLELIATRSTGFDHIATDWCEKQGIVVSNVPRYGANTVAEHVFGLLLSISHHLVEAVDRTRRGDFSLQGLQGFDLHGKTMGVVGTGEIGRCVIAIARGFGMEVVAHDVEVDEELAKRYDFRYAALEEVLCAADVLTLHVPLNAGTRHLIGPEELASMKDGAVLINTARGEVVDTDALVRALHEGKLAAAGLDVLPLEPEIREEAELLRSIFRHEHDLETLLLNHVLLRLRNVVITPHSAFYTREALERILETTRENIESFLAGGPSNVVAGPASGGGSAEPGGSAAAGGEEGRATG